MANDPVDVLIVGAGASAAAFAWSLTETRMNILCLEQGGWMKPTDYPTNFEDYEVRAMRQRFARLLRGRARSPRSDRLLPVE